MVLQFVTYNLLKPPFLPMAVLLPTADPVIKDRTLNMKKSER
jgi:hypothetical protein